jgi:hypothetical protein
MRNREFSEVYFALNIYFDDLKITSDITVQPAILLPSRANISVYSHQAWA